jgi:hypothetical protein
MNKKNCHVCNSNSTVLDQGKWSCFQHIIPCKCKKDHERVTDWDFNQSRGYADGYTVEGMEYQLPLMDISDGHGGILNYHPEE